MLNRNDRSALKRNRSAVSWLCLLCLVLLVWIKLLYNEMSTFSNNVKTLKYDLETSHKLYIDSEKAIDSLVGLVNYKPIDTPKIATKPYKSLNKDSLITKSKSDSIKLEKKDTISKLF